ncbi:MAG: dihydrolipoyllysine-residue acetyltransferase [Alcanivoracaceae bacterium]|nr:dihydrolipoyllysine-residue acetyltransferase [Alcanivoracaceae bacterium]
MGVETIKVPDVGSSDPVDVIEVSVKVGDTVAAEETILVLESDKASIEVPAPLAGTVKQLLVKVGDRVKEGDPLMEVAASGDDASPAEETTAPAEPPPQPAATEAPAAPAASADSEEREQVVPVPDLGDIDGAELIEFSVAEGDTVAAEDVLAVLESDKASLEIPAPAAGTVTALLAKVGDKLGSGDALLRLSVSATGGDETSSTQKPAASETASPAPASQPDRSAKAAEQAAPEPARVEAGSPPAQQQPTSATVHAGPAVRKLARELGVDLAGVTGSGVKGRIVKDDVHAHVKQRLAQGGGATAGTGLPTLPDIDFSRFGEVERIELNKLRKVSAANLHRSWVTVPHVTQHDDADITDLEAFRQTQNQRLKADGHKLTMLAFLTKACAVALQAFPHFNSSLENTGEALIQKHYINIGVAVDTPNGLVVPVVRDADRKGIIEIADEISALAQKARDRKLSPGDMQGGTFSISSLGGIGGTAFTPIVNWPEVAILGVSRSSMQPVWDGDSFQPRLMLPLSLSYDHRVIDGADAARFITFLSETLQDMRRALL